MYEFYLDLLCKLNQDFFLDNKKKCLILNCQDITCCYNAIKDIQNEYHLTDLFYNIENEFQFLFILKCQKNPTKKPEEYNSFLNFSSGLKTFGFNLSPFFNSFINKLTPDIKTIKSQIIDLLKNLNDSRICILINLERQPNDQILSLIEDICQDNDLETKFILFENKDQEVETVKLSVLRNANYSVVYDFNIYPEMLKDYFPNFDIEQLTSLCIATGYNLSEIEYIYNKIEKQKHTSQINREILIEILKSSFKKNFSESTTKIIGTAAFLINKFTIEELEIILQNNTLHLHLTEEIESVLDEGVKSALLEVNGNSYEFFLLLIKEAFYNLRVHQKEKIHLAIADYLKENHPFLYDLRHHHLKAGNSPKAKDMLAMELFHCLHFQIKIPIEVEKDFAKEFGNDICVRLKNIYKNVYLHRYSEALQELSLMNDRENEVIRMEINYLNLLLYWKTTEKIYLDILENFMLLETDVAEKETVIFTKLLELSIISNEGDYLKKKPSNLYREIERMLSKHSSLESEYLLNVLRRKSNTALTRANAYMKVKESFIFFYQRKEIYPREYFMSGINYIALMIQSSKFNVTTILPQPETKLYEYDNPYYLARVLREELTNYEKDNNIKAYLENNYLIAKYYQSPQDFDLSELVVLEKLLHNMSADGEIMFHMNLGTFYALKQDYLKAKRHWQVSRKLNKNHDLYFQYILNNNEMIANIINGERCNFVFDKIPSIMQDPEAAQYIMKRNELLQEIQEHKTHYMSYEAIKIFFNKKISEYFNNMALDFWSQPYILSDVQFWSEN